MCQVFDTCDYCSCLVLHTVMHTLSVGQDPAGMQAALAGVDGLHGAEDPQFCSGLPFHSPCYSRVQPISGFYDLHFYLLST